MQVLKNSAELLKYLLRVSLVTCSYFMKDFILNYHVSILLFEQLIALLETII